MSLYFLVFHSLHLLILCRGWEPGDAELEEATLVLRLLAELAPARHALAAAPQLTEAAYRLSARWVGVGNVPLCCLGGSRPGVLGRLAG